MTPEELLEDARNAAINEQWDRTAALALMGIFEILSAVAKPVESIGGPW